MNTAHAVPSSYAMIVSANIYAAGAMANSQNMKTVDVLATILV
jgi:hypothetical protein